MGISHQIIPASDFDNMLNEQREFDLEVADLIVNIDNDTIIDCDKQEDNENDDEFVEVNLITMSATTNPTMSTNRPSIGKHKTLRSFKWKEAKSSLISMPKNVVMRLKERYSLPLSHPLNLSFSLRHTRTYICV
jgi:hypothetical protein